MFLAQLWFIFLNLWVKKFLPHFSSFVSQANSYGFLALCQNLEKTNDTIPRKCRNRWKGNQKDRRVDRPYITGYRTLPANTGGPKLNNCLIVQNAN